uniref:Maternal effect embryo arrest 22 n=1 Tax=Zea mays TaxID=4577 RepID=A0A804NCU9_MAIZE
MAAEPREPTSSLDAQLAASSSSAAGVGGPNPCCATWKNCQKLVRSRTALREAVKLLQAENEKLRKENSELSKVCKEEHLRGDSAEAARATESDARDLLEKEIIELKTQNMSLKQTQNTCKNNDELLRISELEEENRKLIQILGEERKKITSEKKKIEEEKCKTLEMQRIWKSEAQKSEEYRRVADTERKVANDWRASCERLRSEANELRAQLTAQIQKTEEILKRAEAEKQKVAREKKRADSEKSLSEKNRTLVEVEKKKVTEEKCRADNLFAKLEEQKKLNEHLRTSIQVETKNAIEEKKRGDHLFQKLEEMREQTECLQRKANEFSAGRDVISSGKCGRRHIDRISENANVKLLKEKLKLKKEQLKHVKNVSKLDKAKTALIRRELQSLKQDWTQLLGRFNMLDDHLARGVEDIHVLTQLNQHPEIHGFEQKLLPNDSVPAPYFRLQAGTVPFGSSIPSEYTSYQLPRESCSRSISGTSSELCPPLGSSHRLLKSKCQHRSSCPTSISDEKFMGSQGKDNLFVSSTDIRKKQDSVVPELAPKIRNDRALPCGTLTDRRETLGGDRKRKHTKMSQDPSAFLPSKNDLLHLKSKVPATTSNVALSFDDDPLCLQQGNNTICVTEGDMDKAPSFSFPSKVSCGGNGCTSSKFASLIPFEEMVRENCLKLLNLDDDADEEKFRKAKERPHSPNLSIIRPRRTKLPTYAEPHSLGRSLNGCPALGSDAIDSKTRSKASEVKEPVIQKSTQNYIQLDPSSNTIECSGIAKPLFVNDKSNAAVNVSCSTSLVVVPASTSFDSLLHEHVAQNSVASSAEALDSISRPMLSGGGHSDSILHLSKEVSNKNNSHLICDKSSPGLQANVRTSETTVTKPNNSVSNSLLRHHHGSENPPLHLVGFTRMKRSKMINIFRYWEILSSQSQKHSDEASVDGPLLDKVSTDTMLPIDEKVSLIFSLLLWDTRFTEETFVDGNFASSAFSSSVKSHMETRWTILRGNDLDLLNSLIEDFLLNKEVVVCEKTGQKVFGANKDHELDDETGVQLSVKPAKINEFIAACILLASICGEVGRVDIVLEVSYKVLQMGKSNILWTLLALHVFASMCGDKFLAPKSCNFLMTTIRLVVLLLESNDTSLCLVSSYIQSNKPTTLPSCAHCLFNVDTVSIDGFISSLLDELDLCSLQWNNRTCSNENITRCSSHMVSSGLDTRCSETCNIFKQGKLSEDTHNYPAEINLCYFTELISLLELFGIYMSCEWTYNNVVIRLLEILELCMCRDYSAALLVLVSQLGRSFVDDVGYEERSVSKLRNKLSLLLTGAHFTKSWSLSVQFTAIGALVSVLPLPFDKIVATGSRQLSGSFDVEMKQISEWFVQLSSEHQYLARSFFSC